MLIVFKAYKFRLYLDNNQRNIIHQTFGCTRFIYNYFLTKKDENKKKIKQNLTLKEMKSNLVMLKKEND